MFGRGWLWKGTSRTPRHVDYIPAHRTLLPLVNPNDGHPGFFMVMPLQVISAGAFGRVEPDRIYSSIVHESKN